MSNSIIPGGHSDLNNIINNLDSIIEEKNLEINKLNNIINDIKLKNNLGDTLIDIIVEDNLVSNLPDIIVKQKLFKDYVKQNFNVYSGNLFFIDNFWNYIKTVNPNFTPQQLLDESKNLFQYKKKNENFERILKESKAESIKFNLFIDYVKQNFYNNSSSETRFRISFNLWNRIKASNPSYTPQQLLDASQKLFQHEDYYGNLEKFSKKIQSRNLSKI